MQNVENQVLNCHKSLIYKRQSKYDFKWKNRFQKLPLYMCMNFFSTKINSYLRKVTAIIRKIIKIIINCKYWFTLEFTWIRAKLHLNGKKYLQNILMLNCVLVVNSTNCSKLKFEKVDDQNNIHYSFFYNSLY